MITVQKNDVKSINAALLKLQNNATTETKQTEIIKETVIQKAVTGSTDNTALINSLQNKIFTINEELKNLSKQVVKLSESIENADGSNNTTNESISSFFLTNQKGIKDLLEIKLYSPLSIGQNYNPVYYNELTKQIFLESGSNYYYSNDDGITINNLNFSYGRIRNIVYSNLEEKYYILTSSGIYSATLNNITSWSFVINKTVLKEYNHIVVYPYNSTTVIIDGVQVSMPSTISQTYLNFVCDKENAITVIQDSSHFYLYNGVGIPASVNQWNLIQNIWFSWYFFVNGKYIFINSDNIINYTEDKTTWKTKELSRFDGTAIRIDKVNRLNNTYIFHELEGGLYYSTDEIPEIINLGKNLLPDTVYNVGSFSDDGVIPIAGNAIFAYGYENTGRAVYSTDGVIYFTLSDNLFFNYIMQINDKILFFVPPNTYYIDYPSYLSLTINESKQTIIVDYAKTCGNVGYAEKSLFAQNGIIESDSTANGHYIKYGNGLIIQWGTYTNGNNWNRSLTTTITLPIAFSDTNYTVTITPKMWTDGNTFRNASIGWQNKSTSQFYASVYGVGSADGCNGISWYAIGF